MKITEYIEALQGLLNDHGDLEVENCSVDGRRTYARSPQIAYQRILKGRESKPSFWYSFDEAERKGTKVVRL